MKIQSATPKRLRNLEVGNIRLFKFGPTDVSSAATKEGIKIKQQTVVVVNMLTGECTKAIAVQLRP